MRVTATLLVLSALLGSLSACGFQAGPVFRNIQNVKIRHIGPSGLTDTELDALKQKEMIKCLYQTTEVEEEETLRDLLQTTFLLVISDAAGDRNFELYTQQNLKGNKGKYYVNRCVHPIIRDLN
jgi:hypothetical protein